MNPGHERLKAYLREHSLALLLGALGLLCSCILSLFSPLAVRWAVDSLVQQASAGDLLRYAALILGLAAIQGVFTFTSRMGIIGVSRDIEYSMRRDFLSQLLRQPLSYYNDRRVGDLISLASNDLSAVRMMLGPAVLQSLNTVFLFVANISMMTLLSPRLTLLAVCTLPVISLCAKFFGQHIHDRFDIIQKEFASLSSRVQETLSGVRVVRAYGQEEAECAAFWEQNTRYLESNLSIIGIQAFFQPLLLALTGMGFVIVLWYGGLEVIRHRMTLGAFVQFTLYVGRLGWPMVALGWVVNLFQRGTASLKRMEAEWGREPEIRGEESGQSPPHVGRLEFRQVHFSYPSRPEVLTAIDLEIGPGQTVGIVGRTGCGKSTLLNTVSRLIDVESGEVRVDGVDVRRFKLSDLRGRIGHVSQDSFLFSRSLADNIAFGVDDASGVPESELVRAVEAAGLKDDVAGFPNGLQTLIGERGVTLSGGQKQRVALARALLVDPEILLLDDAFSSVDSHTEAAILDHLQQVRQGRTTLIVTHRLAAVRHANRIAVLDGGRLTAVGTHDELLASSPLYAELWEQQRLEGEVEEANV